MHLPTRRLPLLRYLLAAATALWGTTLVGCNATSGRITPAHFKFRQVVKKSGADASGWRAVCINARFTHGNTGLKGVCKFEVGVPLRNTQQGEIPLETAQEEAAKWANRAAHMVMAEAKPEDLTGPLCYKFKTLYRLMLSEAVHGAQVSDCVTRGVDTVPFDVETK